MSKTIRIPSWDSFINGEIESGKQLMLIVAMAALMETVEWQRYTEEEAWNKLRELAKDIAERID